MDGDFGKPVGGQRIKHATIDVQKTNVDMPAKTKKPADKPRHKRKWLLLTIIVTLVLITAGTYAFVRMSHKTIPDPFSASVRSSVPIPLYYPTQLPKGFHIDTSSISQPESGVVVFTTVNHKGQKIYISEEAVPGKDFDFKKFYGNFTNSHTFSTPLGTATNGQINGSQNNAASIVINNKTWIIISAGRFISGHDLQAIVQHLTLSL